MIRDASDPYRVLSRFLRFLVSAQLRILAAMIVPLELQVLVQKLGRLTPELVLAWRTAVYVGEFFDGLDEVRIAVPEEGDIARGLETSLTESRYPLHVMGTDEQPTACHALVWHEVTGTVLEITFSALAVDMDEAGIRSADGARRGDFFAEIVHGASLDRQVERLINVPMDSIAHIRVRRIDRGRAGASGIRCRRCGDPVPGDEIWFEDGVAACAGCLCIPRSWTRDS